MSEAAATLQQVYQSISLKLLERFTGKLPFDIYVQRSKTSYTKIFKIHDTIDFNRVEQYKAKGINNFFVTKLDYQAYSLIVEKLANKYFKTKFAHTSDEAAQVIKELVSVVGTQLHIDCKINEHTIEQSANVVNGCIETLGKDPKALIQILKLMGSQPYNVRHAIMVSILAIILAKKSKIENKGNLANIGLGGFLHDIGISRLSFNPEDKDTFDQEEWKEVKTHPELGNRLLDSLPEISSEVKQIVICHHEQPNGNGYPNGLRDPSIFMPAKIVAIADGFSALISKRSYREAYNTFQAIKIMEEDSGKYDKTLFRRFSDIFVKI